MYEKRAWNHSIGFNIIWQCVFVCVSEAEILMLALKHKNTLVNYTISRHELLWRTSMSCRYVIFSNVRPFIEFVQSEHWSRISFVITLIERRETEKMRSLFHEHNGLYKHHATHISCLFMWNEFVCTWQSDRYIGMQICSIECFNQ